jgi:hypothetical protein
MHLPMTKFHMYLGIIIFQDINTNAWKISLKGAFRRWFAQRNNREAHQLKVIQAKYLPRSNLGPVHTAHHVKAVVRGPGQGSGDPLLVPLYRPFVWRWHVAMQKVVELILHAKYRCTHHLTPCINRGVESPLQHTPQGLSPLPFPRCNSSTS